MWQKPKRLIMLSRTFNFTIAPLKQIGFITARKRSLRRLCFYRCLSFCPQGGRAWLLGGGVGGCAWLLPGGMRGCSGGGHVWLLWGWAWLLWGGMRGCSGGHAWLLGGACMVAPGEGTCVITPGGCMHGCSGGHAWLLPGGACMVALGGMHGCSGGACVVFSMRYGQWAGGTHPTGMHSCYSFDDFLWCFAMGLFQS